MAIIPLIGLFTIPDRPSNTPLKMFFIPSQARFQSPVNTPATKSIIPLKISLIEFHISEILLKNALNTLPITPKFFVQSLVNIPDKNSLNSLNFCLTKSHTSFAFVEILSQFFQSRMPIAIAAAIAMVTGPPKAVVTKLSAPATLFMEPTILIIVVTKPTALVTNSPIFHAAKNDPTTIAIFCIVV